MNFITSVMEICEEICKEIQRTNPGSTAKLSRSSDNSLRLFVAYKAAIYGFKQACRPLVMLDCKKMEGKCQGVWLFAMAIDAKDDVFPVSYAFVESKNLGSWTWFCVELAQVLECIPKLTFKSDRREGILEVDSGIFPYASHGYSQMELIGEVWEKSNCQDQDLDQLFKNAVYAGGRSQLDACMHEIHDKYKEASREVSITGVLVKLHDYMIEIFDKRFNESSNWNTTFVPRVEEAISDGEKSKYYCVSGGAAEFEVRYANKANAHPKKVDLERRTCSCLAWKKCGYPCEHAIAAIEYSGCDYVDVHHRVDKYRETYSEVIHPLHLDNKSQNKGKKRKHVDSEVVSLTDWLQSG
ncbi:uncharacterized protein LOC131246144 [Magnolia sinica]|uniref:uncharacterized protein LOC131246144 n=1 Tax=Magnolia sinica TaxID=86752 RepID=UPI00265A3129|nr:uncharacterized protein LOC131246144 [Magnolia sinica]